MSVVLKLSWTIRRIAGLASVLVLLVGCASSAPAGPGTPASLGSIVVGTGIDVAYGAFVAAVRQGFFKKNGVDAELKIFQSGIEGVEATVTGQADISGGGAATVIQAAAKGGDVKFLGSYSFSEKQTGVVVNKAVAKPKDLEGRTVCTQLNGNSEQYYEQYVKYHQLDKTKIKFKDIKYQQLPIALAQGECDAIFSQEPAITRALSTVAGSYVIERGGDNGLNRLFVHAIVNKKIYSNTALGNAVVRSMVQAGDWANTHQDEMAQLITTEYKIPLADARRYVGYFRFDFRYDKLVREDLSSTAEFLLSRKLLQKPFDAPAFIDDTFVKAVVPERS